MIQSQTQQESASRVKLHACIVALHSQPKCANHHKLTSGHTLPVRRMLRKGGSVPCNRLFDRDPVHSFSWKYWEWRGNHLLI